MTRLTSNEAAPGIAALTERFETLRAAFGAEPYPDRAVREDRLRRLERALLSNADRLVEAMSADFSYRPAFEGRALDISTSLGAIRHARRSLRRWMRVKRVPVPLHLRPARARIFPQPKGVVGVISPWNFPIYLALPPIADALAAGNRVMLKPSELAPRTSAALETMMGEAFEPDEVSVVQGGPEVGAAFTGLPFDHLFFTGSTEVGRKVAIAAARNLTPVTLELGGKSPAIVLPSADIGRTARRIAWGRATNAGQACVAPDYVLAPREKVTELADAIFAAWQGFYPEGTASRDLAALISDRHLQRLKALVAEAYGSGAEIRALEETHDPARSRKMAPTLVIGPDPSLPIMQEEIFGPVLPILAYDTVEAARAFVTARPRPLALYLFSEAREERAPWLTETHSGALSENETVVHVGMTTLPFGGIGASGMGACHGEEGFRSFSHMKSVMTQPRLNGVSAFDPPITAWKRRLARVVERIA